MLVETAFITNPSEEERLQHPAHREKLARRDPRWRERLFPRDAAAGHLVCRDARNDMPRVVAALQATIRMPTNWRLKWHRAGRVH